MSTFKEASLRPLKSPITRISFGLVMLTVSLILISDMLGFIPNSNELELSYRRYIAQSTSVQLSMEISSSSAQRMQQIVNSSVERNERVLSMAVRQLNGVLVVQAGDHEALWDLAEEAEITSEQVRVGLFSPKGEWGRVEIVFSAIPKAYFLFKGGKSVLLIILYVGVCGFFAYLIFLKRVMRELDPEKVLPERVSTALDSLSDGLLLINQDSIIMFSNRALARRVGVDAKSLIGTHCENLGWKNANGSDEMPWSAILKGDLKEKEQPLNLQVGEQQVFQFIVTASPIYGDDTVVRGALISLNDITEVERKHAQLEKTLAILEESQAEIEEKNKELFNLATRDPLTDVFNRRAFFDAFDQLFERAKNENLKLGCIMLDIDHFKSVNDTFGHSLGDEVIKYLANTLTNHMLDGDVVGRFGGEEFCMIMPNYTEEEVVKRAEVMRLVIESGQGSTVADQLSITTSFGVACLPSDANSPSELIEHADLALYEAKEAGRNRVVSWQGEAGGRLETQFSKGAAKQQLATTEPEQSVAESNENTSTEITSQQLVVENNDSVLPLVIEEPVPQKLEFKEESELSDANSLPETMASGRRESDRVAVGAQVLVESADQISDRALLMRNIDTAINRSKRFGHCVAVLVFDGSGLQSLINSVDSSTGIKLLSILVDRIKNVLRSVDVVSRSDMPPVSGVLSKMSNSDMVILISDIDTINSIPSIVRRLTAVFEQNIDIDHDQFELDTLVGVSIFGEDGHSAADLIKTARVACDRARLKGGRNTYLFHSPSIDLAAKRNLQLKQDLAKAIENQEFRLLYQPKMDVQSGQILGFEALLRWHHSTFNAVSPVEFIPIAEQTGLISSINHWVLEEVVEQLHHWKKAGLMPVSVAVNLSPSELEKADYATEFLSLLAKYGVPNNALEVEITESVDMGTVSTAQSVLQQLSDAGVSVSIDDFGTGYASLNYLQQFPISRLKIDRSFVKGCTEDIKKARVIRSIITMGNSLGMRVLAEGVETIEQVLFLREQHCDEVQGYFVSHPVDADQVALLLEDPFSLSHGVLSASQLGASNQPSILPLSGFDSIISVFPGAAANTEMLDHGKSNARVQVK